MLKRALIAAAALAGAGPGAAANAQADSLLSNLLAAPPAAEAPEVRIDTRAFSLAEAATAAERLDDDVLVLVRIVALQQRLLETNAARTLTGSGPLALPRRICTASPLAAMCDSLPLTFAPASGDPP